MTRPLLITSVVALSLLAGGCSAVRVSSGDDASEPVRVGIDDGSSRSAEPSAPTIPPGMSEIAVDLGEPCPITVKFAADPEWDGSLGYDGYRLFTRGNGALITVNCNESDDTEPAEIVQTAQERIFAEAGSRVLAERTGEITGGEYWTFRGIIAPEDIRAIESTETMLLGAIAGVRDEGRQYSVSVEMVTKSEDEATTALFETMLPTVSINGERLSPPPAPTG